MVDNSSNQLDKEIKTNDLTPLVKSNITLNGVSMTLLTHQADQAHGAMFRGERSISNQDLAELNFLKNAIKPNSYVLEIGSNIGAFAIMMAKVQPSAKIYCFEPDPLNYSLLNINLLLNNITNISAFNFAVGKKQEFINMYLNPNNLGDHRSAKPKLNSLNEVSFKVSSSRTLKVNPQEVVTLIIQEQDFQFFDFLKIDTQGADFEILEASLPLLRSGSVVSIEYSPYHLACHGTTLDEVGDLLAKFSRIERVMPMTESSNLILESIRSLLSFFEERSQSYQGYCDLVLTL